jgi:hypothetical protein
LYEPRAFDDAARATLEKMGHTLALSNREYGNMHAILWNTATDEVTAASDPRGEGESKVWATPLFDALEEDTSEIAPMPETDAAAPSTPDLEAADDALEDEVRFSAPLNEGSPPEVQ